MKKWFSLTLDKQFIIFLLSVISLNILHFILQLEMHYIWIIFFAILFSIINLILLFIHGFRKSIWEWNYLLIALLYLTISLKVQFTYYNFLIPVILTILTFYILKKNKIKIEVLKNRLTLLLLVNCILIFLPDITVFKYTQMIGCKIWGNTLKWKDFKGIDINNDNEIEASVNTGIFWKYNKAYNIPRIISLSLMGKKESWVHPDFDVPEGNLIKHERIHFDITEWTRRECMDSISNLKCINKDKATEVFACFYELKNRRDKEYDSISKHGTDFVGQIRWNKKVKTALSK
ncbi:MAG: hypothetical protein GX612_04230 [Bacteroidales bacterium]|nr:hypothetical protein [Bacteroidales bacterium]OQA92077.1 MAG: hypothetical protein BWY27_00396 [Bacteroidetes bacterium ADurb.Bin234]